MWGKKVKQNIASVYDPAGVGGLVMGRDSQNRLYPLHVNSSGDLVIAFPSSPDVNIHDSIGASIFSISGYLQVEEKFYGNTRTIVAPEVTRPNNTTAYAALDVVSDSNVAPTLITFTPLARVIPSSNYITKLKLATDDSTCVAQFRVHFYNNNSVVVGQNDNTPFTQLYSNQTSYIGYMDLPPLATEGTGSTAAISLNITDRLAWDTTDQACYAILETLTAFTPKALQKFLITASSENM